MLDCPWGIAGTSCSHHQVRPQTNIAVGNIWSIHFTWNKLLKITTKWPPGQIGHQNCMFEWSRAIEIVRIIKGYENQFFKGLGKMFNWGLWGRGCTACSHHRVRPLTNIAVGSIWVFLKMVDAQKPRASTDPLNFFQ